MVSTHMREVSFVADGRTATTCVISIFSTSGCTEDRFVPTEGVGDFEKASGEQQIKGASSLVCFLTVQGPEW